MKLEITKAAADKLQSIQKPEHQYLLLFYDTVGVGCKMNGIPTVRLLAEPRDGDEEMESEGISAIIGSHQKVYFAEEVKLDFANNVFRLLTKEGFLNALIPQTHLLKDDALEAPKEPSRGSSC